MSTTYRTEIEFTETDEIRTFQGSVSHHHEPGGHGWCAVEVFELDGSVIEVNAKGEIIREIPYRDPLYAMVAKALEAEAEAAWLAREPF